MSPDRLSRLTERERAYLRLVCNAHSSKEIALRFRVEPGTVDKALKSAMAKLGTSSRREAARLLMAAEEGQKLGCQPPSIEPAPRTGMIAGSGSDGDWRQATSNNAVREEQAPYWGSAPFDQAMRLPIPRYKGERNELKLGERLIWVGGIALGIVIIMAALTAIGWGAGRLISRF